MAGNLTPSQINSFFPISGMIVYRGALVLLRSSNLPKKELGEAAKRGEIQALSKRSLHNLALMAGNSVVEWKSLMTLTYGANYPLDGRRVKDDLTAFITGMRRQFGRFEYLWFMEFQSRGAPHYHVFTNIGPPGQADRVILADIWTRQAEKGNFPYSRCKWQEGVLKRVSEDSTRDACRRVHQHQRAWEEIRTPEGAARYAVKYATKTKQKKVPLEYRDVGRFWGASRGVKLPEPLVVSASEEQVRQALAELRGGFESWEVLPRVIFY